EPGSGSDAAGLSTAARRDGDFWVLNGTKRFISNAPHAGLFIVMARSETDSTGARGVSAFLVEAGTPGVQVQPAWNKMGQKGAAVADVVFEDARIPADALLGGREGQGFRTAMKSLDAGRIHIAAVAVGLATLAARGGRMDMLLLNRLSAPATEGNIDVYPVMGLMAETWLWLALIGVGMVVGKWVQGWFNNAEDGPAPMPDGDAKPTWDIRMAIGALVIGFFIAWSVITFAAGEPMAPIEIGQLFFALILAFLLAALVAQWFFDLRDRIWMLVVVGLVASAAYWFGQPQHLDAAEKLHTHIAIENPLVRPLPIEYAALGAIGVLLERDFMSILFVVIGYAPRDRQAEPANA
ncbi:MAG: acyl-CoA dehydrogenase family protein, partial [Phycisphaerales bacterium]|nr:acyl-CoA dehydrogenase family protein [Phycisphaerales bacterium]